PEGGTGRRDTARCFTGYANHFPQPEKIGVYLIGIVEQVTGADHCRRMSKYPLKAVRLEAADARNLSPGAERMRISRQRRRDGLQCLMIELRVTEIDELVRRGYLCVENRNDHDAIKAALYRFLDRRLAPKTPVP